MIKYIVKLNAKNEFSPNSLGNHYLPSSNLAQAKLHSLAEAADMDEEKDREYGSKNRQLPPLKRWASSLLFREYQNRITACRA